MKVYTKTGDDGTTSLVGGTRVSKSSVRLEAYGTADELNSFIGLLRAEQALKDEQQGTRRADLEEIYSFLQNKLFNLGTVLATESDSRCLQMVSGLFINADDVSRLEHYIDELEATLEPIHSFILPAGSKTIALAHVCRTIARRLERRMVELNNELLEDSDEEARRTMLVSLQFVNRMSDLFFIIAKNLAKTDNSEIFLWKK